MRARNAEINQCGQTYGVPPKGSRATIVITAAGKTRSVSFEPASLEASPLGKCIKNVLSTVTFPTAKSDLQVSVTLHVS